MSGRNRPQAWGPLAERNSHTCQWEQRGRTWGAGAAGQGRAQPTVDPPRPQGGEGQGPKRVLGTAAEHPGGASELPEEARGGGRVSSPGGPGPEEADPLEAH